MADEGENIPGGFILVARKIANADHWIWQLPEAALRLVWWLLLKARWKAQPFTAPDGTLLDILRGQYAVALRRLADESGLTYQKVRTSLQLLVRREFLTHKVTHGVTVITICNYEYYQDFENYINATFNPHLTQAQRKLNALKKQGKQGKQVKEDISEENVNAEEKKIFDTWNEHSSIKPTHRVFTGAMRRAATARLRHYSADDICVAIRNYGDSTEKFWAEFRKRAGWTLDEFLSRGEGAKIEKFLAGPKGAPRPKRDYFEK